MGTFVMSRGASNLMTQLPARGLRAFPWADVDRRSRPAREVAADYIRLTQDLGGADTLSTQQLALVERASFLLYRIRQYECSILAGREPLIDAGTHSNYVNVLMGVLKGLGLKRQARNLTGPQTYLEAARGASAAA